MHTKTDDELVGHRADTGHGVRARDPARGLYEQNQGQGRLVLYRPYACQSIVNPSCSKVSIDTNNEAHTVMIFSP